MNQLSSKTSLGQRNQLRGVQSNISSGFNLANQMSSKRLSRQFPIETYININDELNANYIYDKYIKSAQNGRGQKQSFKGELKSAKKEGFGTYVFNNYDQYTGYWSDDKMHGKGIYFYHNSNNPDVYVYIGQFISGKFNGIGKLIHLANKNDKDGTVVYQGFWQNGEKSGYGIYFYGSDTSIYYEGYWQNDMKNGQGRLLFRDGQYSGLWRDDKKHGQGKLRIQRRQRTLIYQGEWNNDQLNEGQITYLSPGPQSVKQGGYKGRIRNGKKDGKGIFEYKNIFMEGVFDNDYFTGKGVLYNNQYRIEGDFLDPKSILKGKITYSNGDVFEGVVDIASGIIRRKQGQYRFKNGDKANGKFDDRGSGNIIGFFQYIWSNGIIKRFDN